MPEDGSQPRFSEKMMTRISANQKVGTAIKNRVINMVILSRTEYCLIADIIPTGMPMITENTIPEVASTTVLPRRPIIRENTACPLR